MSRADEIIEKYINKILDENIYEYPYHDIIDILEDIKKELEDEYNR